MIAPSGILLFDCPFEGDDYATAYAVRRVEGVDARDSDAGIQRAGGTAPIASIAVDAITFDTSGRHKIRLPPKL